MQRRYSDAFGAQDHTQHKTNVCKPLGCRQNLRLLTVESVAVVQYVHKIL